jgi:hypothetical protein
MSAVFETSAHRTPFAESAESAAIARHTPILRPPLHRDSRQLVQQLPLSWS